MWLNDNLYFKRPKTNSFSYTLNTSCLERQQFMEKFIAEVQQVHGDVRGGILNQLVDCCASGVNATGHNLYLADGEGKRIWKFLPESTKPVNLQIVREGSTIACYVAATKETICTSDIKDERYPEGVGVKGVLSFNLTVWFPKS
eukprot:TCONS_00043401-protein